MSWNRAMPKTLILATGNPGKSREMAAYLTDTDIAPRALPDSLDIEETGTTFEENARLKASKSALATGEWSLADDSGLEVTALGGAPGIRSARYGRTDRERIERLLRELGDAPERSARFVCVLTIARPDGSIALSATGICPGEILTAPRGEGGFGYDPIFLVPAYHLTFAEMSPEMKRRVGHRGMAFARLLPELVPLLGAGHPPVGG
jgi:XTP/dITP diphosphohydrolase